MMWKDVCEVAIAFVASNISFNQIVLWHPECGKQLNYKTLPIPLQVYCFQCNRITKKLGKRPSFAHHLKVANQLYMHGHH